MDVSNLSNIANINRINSVSLVDAYNKNLKDLTSLKNDNGAFGSLLNAAMNNINTTNALQAASQQAEIKWALGELTSTHELSHALQKASVAMQYTIAVRDKVMEAYKEIMQMQI